MRELAQRATSHCPDIPDCIPHAAHRTHSLRAKEQMPMIIGAPWLSISPDLPGWSGVDLCPCGP